MNSQSKVNLNGDGRGGAASEVAFEEVLGGLKAAQERRAHHNVDACPFLRHLLQHIGSAWPGRVTSLRSCHILASFATRESQQEKRRRAFCQGKKKEKGVKEKSVKEKGVKEKGVKEKGVKQKGVKEKGVLLTASASGLLTASAWRKRRRLAKTPSRGTKRQHTEKGNANENEREPALEREDDMQKNAKTTCKRTRIRHAKERAHQHQHQHENEHANEHAKNLADLPSMLAALFRDGCVVRSLRAA